MPNKIWAGTLKKSTGYTINGKGCIINGKGCINIGRYRILHSCGQRPIPV